MPILIEFRIINGCCTGQANNVASFQKVTEFRSKTALMQYLSGCFNLPVNTAFKRVFTRNYNKGLRDKHFCDSCGTVYLFGDVDSLQSIELKKTNFETF
jgi:hypothetical protein